MCKNCNNTDDRQPGRRQILGFASALAGGAVLGLLPGRVRAQDCMPFLKPAQEVTTPDLAIQYLTEGNARFVSGQVLNCDMAPIVAATAEGQSPFAAILACIDSRSPPEVVFDQQIGDLFVARVAGNVATDEVLGSLEYATEVAGAKAIVVLGHTHCGAIKGAIDKVEVGENLTTLLNAIQPAVDATPLSGERSSHNHELVEAVAETNVRQTVAAMTAQSPVIAALAERGAIKIVGAIYNVETGKVHFLA